MTPFFVYFKIILRLQYYCAIINVLLKMRKYMKKIWPYIKTQKLRVIIELIIKIIGTLMDLAIPYILTYIIDEVVPNVTKDNYYPIILYGLIMILCSIIGVTFNILANQSASYVASFVTRNLRHEVFSKVENLSANQMDNLTMPSVISRMTTDTYNVHQMVGMMQRIGVRAPILLIGGIIVTLTLDVKLTLVLLATLPLIILASYFVSKIGIPLFTKVQKRIDDMIRVIRENISGIRVIKALSKQDYEIDRFSKVNKEVMNYELKSGYTMTILNPIINILLNLGLVGVIVVGASLVMNSKTEVGKVMAFTTYFTIILNAMLSITRIFIILSRSIASATRIEYILDLPCDLEVVDSPRKITTNIIEFNNVNFSYNSKELNLENINFSLKKGESLGIIGATGSGKTTIVNLLMRFYDVTSGEILINGINVKSYEKHQLKQMFGSVFQNDVIFYDTVRENITFGREASEEVVNKAIRVSQSLSFINELKDGLDTVLAPKGTSISGGQKQRIYIARALLMNPKILILDDSSSALDYKTDSELRKSIKNEYDTTMIVIAQRISSIKNCDKIIILDEGKIVGAGSHQDLINSSTIYNEIYQSQMGGIDHE